MIDIEIEVFDSVARPLKATYPRINVNSEYQMMPSSFPSVSIIEMDNVPYRKTQTSCDSENHAEVLYEINVYSNKKQGKKIECKEIASFVDEIMKKLGFTRIMLKPIPNFNDTSIYRMTGRYKGIVSKDKVIYRR